MENKNKTDENHKEKSKLKRIHTPDRITTQKHHSDISAE